jgi:iron complex outermembrane receptor protein
MKLKPLVVSLILVSPIIFAEEPIMLPSITVEGDYLEEPGISQKDTEEVLGTPVDGGDFLRAIPGVSGRRMGGHGIDPIIRGQGETRLNILLDGAYVHGGCPNRMDPPTAYSPIETYDSVTVIKGSQTVIYGAGGSGGTVLFERKTPRFGENQFFRGKIGGGYTSNSETKEFFGDLTAGNTQGFARGIVEYKDASNYKDGDGNETRSALSSKTGNLIFGYTPDNKTRLELSFEASRLDDVLYSGAGMDSPMSENDTIRLKYENEWGTKLALYYSKVEHVMDNYSLRPLSAPMKMRVPSNSKTQGGRLSHNWLTDNDQEWTLGIDYQHNNRDANRFVGAASVSTPTTLQSIMWPDVDLKQVGLFAELEMPVRAADLLKLGLRYDQVTSDAGRARQIAMGGVSPNTLYTRYYGKTADEHSENNIGGFIRYEHTLNNDDNFVFVSLSRSVRTADATERFLAANNNKSAERWIGNPDLNPEQHHEIGFGLFWKTDNWDMNTSVFYNDVTDYILRDRAHAQSGIFQNDNASIYRNVDAELYGFEWAINIKLHQNWVSRLTLDYVHATNTTDDRPIAQTPPLSGSLNLDYKQATWLLGSKLSFSSKQKRVDDDLNTGSGLDAQQSPGFGVLDFYGHVDINKQTMLKLGINNVFDNTYAYHVNRANVDPFNPEPVQVNEPGRLFWLNVTMKF